MGAHGAPVRGTARAFAPSRARPRVRSAPARCRIAQDDRRGAPHCPRRAVRSSQQAPRRSAPGGLLFLATKPRFCAEPRRARRACVLHKSGGFVQRFGGRVALPLLLPRSGGRPGTSPPSPRPARSRSHGRARATPRPGSRPPATPRGPILSKSPVSVKGTCARGAQGRTAPP